MKFNYAKEKAKFETNWAKEKELLQSENASEELITEIYRFSLEQFNSYRSYYRHKEDLSENDEFEQEQEPDNSFDFLETTDNCGK